MANDCRGQKFFESVQHLFPCGNSLTNFLTRQALDGRLKWKFAVVGNLRLNQEQKAS